MKLTSMHLVLLFLFCGIAHAEWQPLWPGEVPGSPQPPLVEEEEGRGGRLTDTSVPAYWFYPADSAKASGAAVVILPGGGYSILAMNHEGHDYAKWLNERGIAAVLVKYRVSPKDEAGFQYPAPYLDARRAIRLTRQNADEWGIDPEKIGVMGSSAGGHLASMCVTMFNETYELEADYRRPSCRPNFGILLYPVIGMDQPWGHSGSRRHLLGPENPDDLARELATYRRVSRSTPPCFLVHAADDKVVPVRNSLEFIASCAKNKVPVVGHVFSQGGHGFGLSGRGDSTNWPQLLEDWLASEPWYQP